MTQAPLFWCAVVMILFWSIVLTGSAISWLAEGLATANRKGYIPPMSIERTLSIVILVILVVWLATRLL